MHFQMSKTLSKFYSLKSRYPCLDSLTFRYPIPILYFLEQARTKIVHELQELINEQEASLKLLYGHQDAMAEKSETLKNVAKAILESNHNSLGNNATLRSLAPAIDFPLPPDNSIHPSTLNMLSQGWSPDEFSL
jgi:hypothetical protein